MTLDDEIREARQKLSKLEQQAQAEVPIKEPTRQQHFVVGPPPKEQKEPKQGWNGTFKRQRKYTV